MWLIGQCNSLCIAIASNALWLNKSKELYLRFTYVSLFLRGSIYGSYKLFSGFLNVWRKLAYTFLFLTPGNSSGHGWQVCDGYYALYSLCFGLYFSNWHNNVWSKCVCFNGVLVCSLWKKVCDFQFLKWGLVVLHC